MNPPVRSDQSAAPTNVAEFDQRIATSASPVRQKATVPVVELIGGILIVIVGLVGLAGHVLNNHLLLSFLPERREEIAWPTAVASVLLGLAIAQGIPMLNARWRRSNSLLLATVFGIAVYNIFRYFMAARFQFFLPLTHNYVEIPMKFLTAIQMLGISMGLMVYNRYPHIWQAAVGFSVIVFWLLETVLFSVLGYEANLPVLSSYSQSVPAIIVLFIAGLCGLKALTRPEGLLSPLVSPIRRIKFYTVASILMGILILMAGVGIIALFHRFLTPGASTQTSDQLFVSFELATMGLSLLVLLLSLRVLFFYESSLRAEAQVKHLNEQLEQRVLERTAALEKVSRQKSRVLSMVSHDLKTPLAAVGRFAEILDRDKRLLPEQKEMVSYIVESIHQMRAMVTDILDRARIEAGKVRVRPMEIDFETFMAKLLPTVNTLAEERLIDVQEDIQPGLMLIADPILLRQILLNLLSNAVKYNQRQGNIRLRAYEETNGHQVVIEVQDTGIGIPTDKLPLLFNEFYRIGAGLNTVEGTGLGLASTKKLIELHGGRIEVNSVENEGSTFKVVFPQSADTARPVAKSPSTPTGMVAE